MSDTHGTVSLTFLFPTNNVSSSLVNTAKDLGVRIVFDLGSEDPSVYQARLVVADASNDTVDLKISSNWLSDPNLTAILKEVDVQRVWVELEPDVFWKILTLSWIKSGYYPQTSK